MPSPSWVDRPGQPSPERAIDQPAPIPAPGVAERVGTYAVQPGRIDAAPYVVAAVLALACWWLLKKLGGISRSR